MGESVFINKAFTSAIQTYLQEKQNPNNPILFSFPIMVIRTLIAIYGELDIINPYRTNNENRMGGFDTNLTKFGFSQKSLKDFKESFQKYTDLTLNHQNANIYFLKIEKYLIDMFFFRKKASNMTQEQVQSFQTYLYLPTVNNEIMRQEIIQNNIPVGELFEYLKTQIYVSQHEFKLLPCKQDILIPEAYLALGYSLEMIAQLDEKTLSQLNNKILSFFKINSDDPNKIQRLQEAVIFHQRYGNVLSTGNGYVDMLLLISVIATIMMSLFAITVRVLG